MLVSAQRSPKPGHSSIMIFDDAQCQPPCPRRQICTLSTESLSFGILSGKEDTGCATCNLCLPVHGMQEGEGNGASDTPRDKDAPPSPAGYNQPRTTQTCSLPHAQPWF